MRSIQNIGDLSVFTKFLQILASRIGQLLNFSDIGAQLGVSHKNIDHFPFCTRCDKKRFFSFRRDKKEDYGEMMGFIVKSV